MCFPLRRFGGRFGGHDRRIDRQKRYVVGEAVISLFWRSFGRLAPPN